MSTQSTIYLDYASTTPVDPRVATKMMEFLTPEGEFGNPASRSHRFGWKADEAVEEARRIDEASMAKHNREATIISMILGFTALALFVDGLLRILGIIPPFMDIDVNILDKIVERVESDVIDKVRQVPIQKIFPSNFR